jgi:hypothetical protein
MRCNWNVLTLAVAGVLLTFSTFTLAADKKEEGWTNLLPEKKLAPNWTTTGNWTVDDEGVITLTPRPGESGWTRYDAYLWLAGDDHQDFEFAFDYKVQKGGNSGFYFHVGDRKEPVATGIEVQIYDSGNKPKDAKLTDHDSGGIIPGLPPSKNTAKPANEWNHFDIQVKDGHVTVKLNGEVVNELDLGDNNQLKSRPKTGAIGFQDHGLPLSLRNLKIRKL